LEKVPLEKSVKSKVVTIVLLLAAVTCLHYSTELGAYRYHLFYQGLYFLVVMLSGFWFGLRGALMTSATVTLLYLPFVIARWNGLSPVDFGRLTELALYNVMAVVLGVLKDRQRAEQERLREAEGLAAMGKAMSAVAHDLKTPLIAIGGFTSLVQRKLCELSPCEENFPDFIKQTSDRLAIVIRETRRMECMVKEMLDFSRPLELQPTEESLEQLIGDCLSVVAAHALERDIRLHDVSAVDGSRVACDSTRIKQAVINLLMNAIQASPAGETVKIACYPRMGDLVIDIVDSGCGIPPDKREDVFLPFVTTKKEGTGLGLPIVKKIVEAHHGSLKIMDNAERGLTFRLTLPRAGVSGSRQTRRDEKAGMC
jgi:two-component system sensor histidine kinase HydH